MTRILLFGATGYTGELTARRLVAGGARPVLVARNAARVTAVAGELGGLDTAVADVTDPASLRPIVRSGDVLISTVGPFLEFGEPAVRVAAEAGAHYLDSTGEGPFIRQVFERWGPIAQRNGSALLSAFGFDFVPGSLAGALALDRAGADATAVDVGYFVRNFGTSGGTRASVVGVLLADGFGYRDGWVRPVAGSDVDTFEVHGRTLTAVTVPGAEHFALPQAYPTLRDVRVFLGAPPLAAQAMAAATRLSYPVRRVPALRALAKQAAGQVVRGSTGGPDAVQRARSSVTVVAVAKSAAGEPLARVTLDGPDPYDFTAAILDWGARTAAAGAVRKTGALGPVAAFGVAALTDGCADAGLREVAPVG
ncbi:saccharopine dehydrogenase family protein [Skermania piniformis]|uniref:Saccharopine dehydrogenase NADP-binding domain-containing protein n=1 Tax=Skermania pinensis TaxID=39122 RepID=A0ABX8S855_9ACTN|nr:saccharopine dehydrogenase NADP-binding domain-containing protein [Skermania piniformis]QXQ14033.1 saccharopine dehydrogenase NADP-binding domain-containing protein [Skermania piniformis]